MKSFKQTLKEQRVLSEIQSEKGGGGGGVTGIPRIGGRRTTQPRVIRPHAPRPSRGPGRRTSRDPMPGGNTMVGILGHALGTKLGRWGMVWTPLGLTAWLNADAIIDTVIRLFLPGPKWLKDFIIDNTLAVIAAGIGIGLFHRDIVRLPVIIRRALRRGAVINDIKASLELGDDTTARMILFSAIEKEGIPLRRIRKKLSDDQWSELSATVAQNR